MRHQTWGASPSARPHVGLNPTTGDRVASRLTIVPLSGQTVSAARETDATEAAQETAPGTDLEESTVSFDKLTPPFAWVGSVTNVDGGVLDDRGEGEATIDAFARRDVLRALDTFVLDRDDHGILENEDVPTAARGERTRSQAVIDSVAAVRNAGHLGVVSVVVNGTDAAALVNEPTFSKDVLDLLGAELVISSLVAEGTALVADLASAATLWIADPGLTVTKADAHDDGFLSGRVVVRGQVRAFARVQLPSAAQVITEFDVDPEVGGD